MPSSRVVPAEEDDEGWLARLLQSSSVPKGFDPTDDKPDEAWERFEQSSRPPSGEAGAESGSRAAGGADEGESTGPGRDAPVPKAPGKGTNEPKRAEEVKSEPVASEPANPDPSAPKRSVGTPRTGIQRWLTGIVAGAVVLGALALGPVATEALAALVVVAAEIELGVVLRRSGRRLAVPVAILGGLAATVGAFALGPTAVAVVTIAVVPAAFAWELFEAQRHQRVPGGAFSAVAHTVLAYAWVGLLWSFVALLVAPSGFAGRGGIGLLLGTLVMVVAYDAGAYLVGSVAGRHRLAPAVSPGKSVEGAAGGTILALGLGVGAVGLLLHPWTTEAAGLVALVVVVLAPLGDLAESLVKREIGVKDTSGLLPGHGGILDRIDGLLFVLPFAYLVTRVVLGR
jgi:phosphatidate cytidylyltransferase